MPSTLTPEQLSIWLEQPELADSWLSSVGVRDTAAAVERMRSLVDRGLSANCLAELCSQVTRHLVESADADRILKDVARYLHNSQDPSAAAEALLADADGLRFLVRALNIGPRHAELLVRAPEMFTTLRQTVGRPATRKILCDDLSADIAAAQGDFELSVAAIRRYHLREMLRIAHGDLLNQQRLETVAEQNTYLAEAILEAAIMAARAIQERRLGTPPPASRFVAIGLGALGGSELDYSGNIELVFLYDLGIAGQGKSHTSGPKQVATADYYQRLTQTILALIRDAKDAGIGYRVTLHNATSDANVAMRADDAWKYYDTHGETWDRLAFIKARPVAGDLEFGAEFLERLTPWVYRRYLSQVQIASIKSLKRRLERGQLESTSDAANVRDVTGGIRDIEFVTQFMQLLNGGDLSDVRVANTLQALERLQQQGCLTDAEVSQLTNNYIFLRTLEHRIETVMDSNSHILTDESANLLNWLDLGISTDDDTEPLESLKQRLRDATRQNQSILQRLYDAFGNEETPEPAVDLVLDPDPSPSRVQSILQPHGFENCDHAYRNLMSLATEKVAFLSKLRCRHFLASIAPKLLQMIKRTPDPDETLTVLSRVSGSLGGKGALWELFSSNPALMELYVRLCAACPYLSGILERNPGMIDDLMDSLILDRLPDHEQLEAVASDLCRGAEDIEPILHGFKNAAHLSVGVRDIIGKDDIRATTGTLSDIAEICLHQVILDEYEKLVPRLGIPTLPAPLTAGRAFANDQEVSIGLPQDEGDCDLVVLGLGKLGGREPNYHSNLEVLFVYQADGQTRHPRRSRNRETTTNQHFFGELAQRVTRFVNRLGPWGRLYDIDTQFTTDGRKTLAIEHQKLCDFVANKSTISHRQLLCRARPIFGSATQRGQVLLDVHDAIRRVSRAITTQPSDDVVAEIRRTRSELERTASPRNLKRGPGGTIDVEYIVQMLQLRHAADHPELLVPGTLEAIDALSAAGLLDHVDAEYLANSYRFLRSVEARLRLMDTSARHDLPTSDAELVKLAFLLGLPSGSDVERRCQHYRDENRARFDQLFTVTHR